MTSNNPRRHPVRWRSLAFVCAVCWLLPVAPLGAVEIGAPVIPASGFEGGMGVWKARNGRQEIDTRVAHTGKASLRLDDASTVQTEPLPLNGECWRVSFWMRTENVVRGPQPWHRAGLQIAYLNAEGKETGHRDVGLTLGTTEWTRHEAVIYLDPKAKTHAVRLILMNWNCTGTTWFDDVALTREPIPEAYRKFPPLDQVENQPPRIWKLPPVVPLTEPAAAEPTSPVRVVSHAMQSRLLPQRPAKVEEGADIQRGYMTRRVRRIGSGPGPDGWRAEEYAETFRGSPIHSWFARLWLANAQDVGPVSYRLRLAGEIARVRLFQGNRLKEQAPGEPLVLGAETTKPFVILSNARDDAGVILFHPIPAEVRRWHVEDYLIERECPVRLTLAGDTLTYDFGAVKTGAGGFCHSFDFYVFSLPYTGRFEEALQQFQVGRVDLLADALPFSEQEPRGYWQPFMSLSTGGRLSRMARYFPREFASWMDSSGWDYGHPGGHGWGCTTASMKGVRVSAQAEASLARDYALRMLTFFLEAAGETGAPPNQYTWRGAGAAFDDVSRHYTTVFCQYWEWRLEEFRAWLREGKLLTPAEKERIYSELQRARKVYDPAFTATTWSYPTPNGGLWFEYWDQPRGQRRWVINTHATSVGNVGDFALLARDLGKEDDYRYWRRLFERGVDALIWVWEQPDMWADYDPNEVLYARPPDGGPRGYHLHMVTSWTPKVVQLSLEMDQYRLAEIVKYWKRMASAAYTTDAHREAIRPLLEKAEARLAETR